MQDRDSDGYVPLKQRVTPLLAQGMRPCLIAHKLGVSKGVVDQMIYRIRNEARQRQRARAYYQQNKDARLAYQRAYDASHPKVERKKQCSASS